MGYGADEIMAGFEDLDRFGILNILPEIVKNFGMSRDDIFKLSVIEVYIEVQRMSILNKCNTSYQRIISQKK